MKRGNVDVTYNSEELKGDAKAPFIALLLIESARVNPKHFTETLKNSRLQPKLGYFYKKLLELSSSRKTVQIVEHQKCALEFTWIENFQRKCSD